MNTSTSKTTKCGFLLWQIFHENIIGDWEKCQLAYTVCSLCNLAINNGSSHYFRKMLNVCKGHLVKWYFILSPFEITHNTSRGPSAPGWGHCSRQKEQSVKMAEGWNIRETNRCIGAASVVSMFENGLHRWHLCFCCLCFLRFWDTVWVVVFMLISSWWVCWCTEVICLVIHKNIMLKTWKTWFSSQSLEIKMIMSHRQKQTDGQTDGWNIRLKFIFTQIVSVMPASHWFSWHMNTRVYDIHFRLIQIQFGRLEKSLFD